MVMKFSARNISILQIVLSFALLVLVNYLSGFSFMRWDLTEDQRYSLKPATIKLLQDKERFNERMVVEVYMGGDLPADWKKLQREVATKLEEFRAYAGSKFEYKFIDPFENADEEIQASLLKELRENGLFPMSIPVPSDGGMGIKTIVPGALIRYPGKDPVAVTFFPTNQVIVNATRDYIRNKVQKAITDLEYNLTGGVRRATQKNKTSVAVLQGHGELTKKQLDDVLPYLETYYKVEFKDLYGEDSTDGRREYIRALDGFDVLMVAKPQLPFTEKEKYIIDQFVMRGGKVIWMVDGIQENRDTLDAYGRTLGLSLELNLTDQLFQYGVRINNNCILDEFVAPIGIPVRDGRLMVFPWFFYPMVGNRGYHPVSNNLDPVKMEYVSSIDTLAIKGIQKTVLLETTPTSILYNPPVRIFYDWVLGEAKPNFKPENAKPHLPVAVLLEGEFESVFKNRLTPNFASSAASEFQERGIATKMLVVSDGDLIRNDLDTITNPGMFRPVPIDRSYWSLFNQQLGGLRFGNRDFFLNVLDYMTGDESLIASRTRITVRMLDMDKVKAEKGKWQFINIIIPVLIIILVAVVQFVIRKKRYAK